MEKNVSPQIPPITYRHLTDNSQTPTTTLIHLQEDLYQQEKALQHSHNTVNSCLSLLVSSQRWNKDLSQNIHLLASTESVLQCAYYNSREELMKERRKWRYVMLNKFRPKDREPINIEEALSQEVQSVLPGISSSLLDSLSDGNELHLDEKEVATKIGEECQIKLGLELVPEHLCLASKKSHITKVLIHLAAPKLHQDFRVPIDLIAIVDRSTSMRGHKMDLMKTTLTFIVENLNKLDKFSIICFNRDTVCELPLISMDEDGKGRAKEAIRKICTGPGTCLSDSLCMAINTMRQRSNPNRVASLLLFTDGEINFGLEKLEDFEYNMKLPNWLANRTKIHLWGQVPGDWVFPEKEMNEHTCPIHTFGFGHQHNSELLQALAQKGGGIYYFIDQENKITESFAACFGEIVSTVVQDVELDIQFQTNTELDKMLVPSGYKLEKKPGRLVISIGGMACDQQKDFVCSLKLDPHEGYQNLLKVKVSYFNLITKKKDSLESMAVIARLDGFSQPPNPLIDQQMNRIKASMAIKAARNVASTDKPGAISILNKCTQEIENTPSSDTPFVRSLLKTIDKVLDKMSRGSSLDYLHELESAFAANTYQKHNNSDRGSMYITQTQKNAIQIACSYTGNNLYIQDSVK